MRSLNEFIRKRSSTSQVTPVDDKTVFFLFRKIVREEYGLRGGLELEPVEFREGVLSVKANNPLYASELWMRKEALLSHMNQSLEQEVVKELRLARYAP